MKGFCLMFGGQLLDLLREVEVEEGVEVEEELKVVEEELKVEVEESLRGGQLRALPLETFLPSCLCDILTVTT